MLTCKRDNIRHKTLDLLKDSIEKMKRRTSGVPMYCGPWKPQEGLYNGQTYLDRCLGFKGSSSGSKSIYFYEFSDTTRCPLSFSNLQEFMRFLDSSHIKVFPHDVVRMEAMLNIYAICRFGSTELVFAQTKDRMMQELRDELPY